MISLLRMGMNWSRSSDAAFCVVRLSCMNIPREIGTRLRPHRITDDPNPLD